MILSSTIGIIADDLTGANDTALQFFLKGSNTEILLDYNDELQNHINVGTWAISTETRNIDKNDAAKIVYDISNIFKDKLNVEHFYKKIDSTLRGNITYEIFAALEATGKDAAVVVPAYVQEGRITIGGYQLLKGVPIERTDAARDPGAPIYESYIPDILKKPLGDNAKNMIDSIELNIVAKGAGPIAQKLNELIGSGKKIIVVDCVSTIDFEQIVLAMQKTSYEILPCGSAGLAQALAPLWLGDLKVNKATKTVPKLPKLILSGSATTLSALQLQKLENEDDFLNKTYFVSLTLNDIMGGVEESVIKRVKENLNDDNIVAVHVCDILEETKKEEAKNLLIDQGITKEALSDKITGYLAELANVIKKDREFILIAIGGETSRACCDAIGAKYLQVVDGILPAIPLCIDSTAQLVVTKSGNLGTTTTLVEIVRYLEHHENA